MNDTIIDRNDTGAEPSIDYLLWAQRVVGWDALLPFGISVASIALAWLFKNQPPADILALACLPAAAFVARLFVGANQIESNTCGLLFRRLQMLTLFFGLFPLLMIDFFVALAAIAPPQNGQAPAGIQTVCAAALVVYLMCATLAMYPGRHFEDKRSGQGGWGRSRQA